MSNITVHKLNSHGQSVVSYTGEVAETVAGSVRLVAYWTRAPLDLGYTRFETGDRFVEWFYSDRWYSIFEIHAAATDRLKGWYCNIGTPAAIDGERIASRDLYLDLWVGADGTMRVLDEDEFAADTTMSDVMRAMAVAALAELRQRVEQRLAPFDMIW